MSNRFSFKIVVAGPFAAGKTTLITTVSDRPVVGTEAPTSGHEAAVKATTTVGMEYGTLSAGDDHNAVELDLYGVPGQERFSFMWDIVGMGMDGLFLLVNGSSPESWTESASVGRYFKDRFPTPVVVAVNRATDRPDLVDDVRRAIPIPGALYLGFDVINAEATRDAIVELLLLMLDELPEEPVEQLDAYDAAIEAARAGEPVTDHFMAEVQ